MLELYYWEPNTFFLKPLIALREKNAEFSGHFFDPVRFEQFSTDFPRTIETMHNVEHEGPVLVAGDAVMCGSFFLLEYIAETIPGPELYSPDPFERYRMQELGQVIGKTLGICVSLLGCMKYLVPVLQAQDQDYLRNVIDGIMPMERRARWLELIDGNIDAEGLGLIRHRLHKPVLEIEARLCESQWLAGERYSIADIDIFSMIWTLPDLVPEMVNGTDTPRILEFISRMKQRSAVKSAFAMSRSGRPQECFVPGIEPSRWLGL